MFFLLVKFPMWLGIKIIIAFIKDIQQDNYEQHGRLFQYIIEYNFMLRQACWSIWVQNTIEIFRTATHWIFENLDWLTSTEYFCLLSIVLSTFQVVTHLILVTILYSNDYQMVLCKWKTKHSNKNKKLKHRVVK